MAKRTKLKYCKKCKEFYLGPYGHTCKPEEKKDAS